MGIIVTVGNTKKGGTGKSTVATNVAVDLHRSGDVFVKVFDTDLENMASYDFFEERHEEGYPQIERSIIESLADIEDAIKFAMKSDKHVAIIDVAGIDSDITASAVAISDLLFIPFRMSSKDLKALGAFVGHIEDAKSNGATMESYLIPNFLYANSSADKVKLQLAPLLEAGFKYGTALKNRNSYINSAETGQSVTEFGDIKAGAEIRPLIEIILGRL